MEPTTSAVDNSTDRSIESGRLTKALAEAMTVAAHADEDIVYDVTHDEATYRVDVDLGTCECGDYIHRGESVICKHVLRASITHAFRTVANTELVARVLGHVAEAGCIHDVTGCAGPTRLGDRGIPCEGCVAVSPGHWTMWSRLVRGDTHTLNPDGELATADPEPVLATDGGTELAVTHDAGGPGRPERRAVATDGSAATESAESPTGSVRERGDRIVHQAGEWTLEVKANGVVTAYGTAEPYGRTPGWTTRSTFWAPKGRQHRYGKTIERVLAHYCDETKHDRDRYGDETDAKLRQGIIDALCEIAPKQYPDTSTRDAPPIGVIRVNSPAGGSTTVVGEDTTAKSDYATFHAFDREGAE